MGLTVDALSKATPTRLICRGGRWVLELTRLEAVDRDVYQPRLTRLEGADSILAALRRSEEGQGLVGAAAQLMRSPRADEDRVFDVSEGDFVPSADTTALERPPRRDDESSELSRVITELRAELVVLRASHSRLRDRVMALEALQSGLPGAGGARPARGSRPRRRSEPPPPAAALEAAAPKPAPLPAESPAAFAATQASPALGTAAPAAPRPAPADARTFEELAKQFAGEQLPPVLKLPGLPELNACMSTLMDQPPSLEVLESPVDLETLRQLYGCKLLDDEGKERGIIVLSQKAAVLLGASLLGLSHAEAERQAHDSAPSEDALLATSEICNNITGPINAVAGNAHVRSTALATVDAAALAPARGRLDLGTDGGYLILLMF